MPLKKTNESNQRKAKSQLPRTRRPEKPTRTGRFERGREREEELQDYVFMLSRSKLKSSQQPQPHREKNRKNMEGMVSFLSPSFLLSFVITHTCIHLPLVSSQPLYCEAHCTLSPPPPISSSSSSMAFAPAPLAREPSMGSTRSSWKSSVMASGGGML